MMGIKMCRYVYESVLKDRKYKTIYFSSCVNDFFGGKIPWILWWGIGANWWNMLQRKFCPFSMHTRWCFYYNLTRHVFIAWIHQYILSSFIISVFPVTSSIIICNNIFFFSLLEPFKWFFSFRKKLKIYLIASIVLECCAQDNCF